MSDSSHHSLGDSPLNEEQFITSWARISLDYGPTGYELAEDDDQPELSPAERLRAEIEQVIGAIKEAAGQDENTDSSQIDPVLARLEGMEVTDELLEQMLAAEPESGDIPEAEKVSGDDNDQFRSLMPRPSNNVVMVDLSIPPREQSPEDSEEAEDSAAAQEDAEADELEAEISRASSQDVVEALALASVDLSEIMVYEADEEHVDLYVLCIQENEQLLTAQLGDKGVLEPGQNFEEFAAELMSQLPTRGGICADESSYSLAAPVTILGEELRLDADSKVAALVELDMPEVPLLVSETQLASPVEAIPADKGWTLLSTDPLSMLILLQELGKPAIVAESNGYNHHLSFIVPGGSQPNEHAPGSWGEWMNKVVGNPNPSDDESGSVIDLHWGAPKKLSRYLPQHSYALDTLWSLPGQLPDPLNFVRINDEIENLTWVYGLDDSESRRLRNYVEDSASELGMESVLQLLGLPLELSKIALGSTDIDSLPGYRTFAPDMSLPKAVTESALSYPNGGDKASAVSRELMKRPWIFVADGAVQLSASSLLALLAARRRAQGQSARAASLGAATLLGTGLAELALARSFQKLKRVHALQEQTGQTTPKPELSLMEELAAATESHTGESSETDSAQKMSTSEQVKNRLSSLSGRIKKRFGK